MDGHIDSPAGSATLAGMPFPRPDIPGSITGPVTGAEAAQAGLKPWQLKTAGLHRVHRDLWLPSALAGSLDMRSAAALRKLPAGSALSHATAARLRGLPIPAVRDEPIHVTVPAPAQPRIAGIRVHTVAGPFAVVELASGLPVTRGARTWVDLAPSLGRDDRVIAGDAVLRRGFATLAEITTEVDAAAGRRGIAAVREVVAILEPKADSPGETRLRLLLIDHGIGGFVVNEPVFDSEGGWLCQPDIHFPRPRVSLEYQGEHHFADPRQRARDIRKGEVLRSHDWTQLEIVAADLHAANKTRTAHRILDAIGQAS